jgi:hypothetical protein
MVKLLLQVTSVTTHRVAHSHSLLQRTALRLAGRSNGSSRGCTRHRTAYQEFRLAVGSLVDGVLAGAREREPCAAEVDAARVPL